VDSGRNTRCRCSVSGSDDFLRVEEVDAEETDWVKGNEDESENNSDVGGCEIILGDLRSTDSQTELMVNFVLILRE
jgi:hypothetical protein